MGAAVYILLYAVRNVQRGGLRRHGQRHVHSGAFFTIGIFLKREQETIFYEHYLFRRVLIDNV